MTSQHPLRGVVGFVIPGVIALAAGVCGGETGPRRHAISGTVTFKGQPVPAVQIVFELDASRGNRGPAGYAEITDGWYSTHMGAVAGPHIVRINGQTGPVIEETVDVTLFMDYVTSTEIEAEPQTIDFEVPDAAVPPRRRQ